MVIFAQDHNLVLGILDEFRDALKEKLLLFGDGKFQIDDIVGVSVTAGSFLANVTLAHSVPANVITDTQSLIDSESFQIYAGGYTFTSVVPGWTSSTYSPTESQQVGQADTSSSDAEGISNTELIAIVVGSAAVLLVIALVVIIRNRNTRKPELRSAVAHLNPAYEAHDAFYRMRDVDDSQVDDSQYGSQASYESVM